VALPDGRLATAGGRVVKNVSGYDLMKLHFGALGSLGVIRGSVIQGLPPARCTTSQSRQVTKSIDEAWARRIARWACRSSGGSGDVLGRSGYRAFLGSPDAVGRMVRELGWTEAEPSAWAEHSRRAPTGWARIAVPRHELRAIVASLPKGGEWWASPGVGVAHWSAAEAPAVRDARAVAEAAHGSLVIMAAPPSSRMRVGSWGTPPPTVELMRRLKKAFDPKRDLNPGRFRRLSEERAPAGTEIFAGLSDDDLATCVHCGLVPRRLPNLSRTGLETESPRGRIYLMTQWKRSTLPFTRSRSGTLTFASAVALARPSVLRAFHTGASSRPVGPRWTVCAAPLSSAGRRRQRSANCCRIRDGCAALGSVTRVAQAAHLTSVVRSGRQLPPLRAAFHAPTGNVAPAVGERKHRVAFLAGCVMPILYPQSHQAAG